MSEQNKNVGGAKIRVMAKKEGMTLSELARLTDMSASNASNKCKRNNFRESEMRKIAAVLGYDVEIAFVARETGERI